MKLFVIIKKELLDQIRDKRTIVASILMPAVIVPLLLFLTLQKTPDDGLNTPAKINIQNNDTLIKSLIHESFRNSEFINTESPSEAMLKGEADLYIQITKSGEKYGTLTIYYDPARSISLNSYLAVNDLLKSHFAIPEIKLSDVQITSSTIRNDTENNTLLILSLILPVFLMLFAASSTMSSVIDISAGEKERSTIETLLSCSISRTAIILGKISAASVIGFSSVISLISGLILCSHLYPRITGGISLLNFCGIKNILLVLMMTAISVFFFSAAGMVIGLYARSVKEGTILTLPVIILSSALSSGLITSDPFTINRIYLLIPVLNFSYLIRSVIFNHHELLLILISAFINLAYASLLLIISCRLLKKESVIFRS
ncbi:MAG TPA: ABC transporter permease subunit [Spirochaetota bacterium]|nr:ABC transporter permease subunit [Spirochaetota bacterium]HPS87122.1 ABC transporter permease subunit [Spirochaetota bacterium]